MNTKKIKILLKFVITIGIFIILFNLFDIKKITELISHISFLNILLILSTWFISIIIANIRWYILVIPFKKVNFIFLLKTYLIGFFFNTFLPSSIGGDFYRIFKLYKKTDSKTDAGASVFIERLIGFLAIAMIAFISLFFIQNNKLLKQFGVLTGITFACLIVIFFLSLNTKFINLLNKIFIKIHFLGIGEKLTLFLDKLNSYKDFKKNLIISFILSIIYQLIVVLTFYITAIALQINISYFLLVIFVSLMSIITLIPVSIGGLGIREGTFAVLFKLTGHQPESGLALSIIFTFLTSIVHLSGGYFYLFKNE